MSCHCCEHESREHCVHGETQASRLAVIRMVLSGILLIAALFFFKGTAELLVCLIAYLPVGFPVLKEAAENMMHGKFFDENFLMTVASVGAFCIGEYPEAVAVMLLYDIGEMLQDKAVDSSRESIKALVNIRPDHANLMTEDGIVTVEAKTVHIGEMIMVRPGERVPLDGIVREGDAYVDTSPLTGESVPQEWSAGSSALAGCVAKDGALKIEVTKSFGQSSVSRILKLVEDAQENKAKPEQFITRFARVYTPLVCAIAVLVAVLPPLMGWGTWAQFIHKALAFLVISCPCALVISVPLSFFAGIGCSSHHGILMKGGNYLELLAKAEVAAFDKTGTLTEGNFRVTKLQPASGVSEALLLEVAAYCESQSTHPLATAIVDAYGAPIDNTRLSQLKEIAGHGMQAVLDGKQALCGKSELIGDMVDRTQSGETAVYVALDGAYLGCILLSDTIKPDAVKAVQELRRLGLHDLTMLSGDRQSIADQVAREIGLDHAFGALLPEEKVACAQKLKANGETLLYAGDGINDAPILAVADVGIAMGGLGSDAAMEAADMVIMSDEPNKIALAIRIARKTMAIAKENIAFSIAVKVLILTLSLVCNMGLWIAVFADVGVCMLAVLNAMRAMRV